MLYHILYHILYPFSNAYDIICCIIYAAPRCVDVHNSASCAAIPRLCLSMMLCFVGGNTQPTIPYRFGNQRGRAGWAADTRSDTGNGSRLYELNLCHGGCGAMAGGRSRGARSWCCRPWRRGRSAFASLGRGQAKQSSADGWLLGTAPQRAALIRCREMRRPRMERLHRERGLRWRCKRRRVRRHSRWAWDDRNRHGMIENIHSKFGT